MALGCENTWQLILLKFQRHKKRKVLYNNDTRFSKIAFTPEKLKNNKKKLLLASGRSTVGRPIDKWILILCSNPIPANNKRKLW